MKIQMTEEQKAKRREANRKWRQANPEKAKAANLKWRQAHPDKVKEMTSKWRANRKQHSMGTPAVSVTL